MKKIIICDIDGTIANVQHRLHFIKNPDGTKKSYKDTDWDSFHKECINDEPYEDVIEVVHSLVLGHGNGCNVCGAVEREVYFFSGRNDSVRSETAQWLEKHVPITLSWSDYEQYLGAGEPEEWQQHLHMRSEGDRRPDTVVKLEMLMSLGLTPDDVLCILDDRQAVVDMWRENGFRVMQVDAWKEGSVGAYNSPCLEGNKWQDELRNHVDKTAKEHDTSLWTQVFRKRGKENEEG
jgi:hypothetical protein